MRSRDQSVPGTVCLENRSRVSEAMAGGEAGDLGELISGGDDGPGLWVMGVQWEAAG